VSVGVIFFAMAVAFALGFTLGSWRERARGVQPRLAETVSPLLACPTRPGFPTRADSLGRSTRHAKKEGGSLLGFEPGRTWPPPLNLSARLFSVWPPS
jgi:hypothetical protein